MPNKKPYELGDDFAVTIAVIILSSIVCLGWLIYAFHHSH